MKTQVAFILLLFLSLSVFSQESGRYPFSYNIERHFPPISIEKKDLTNAATLLDLNERFEDDWIEEYISVEIFATNQGTRKRAIGKSINLNQHQKQIMNLADSGTKISVVVQYMPDNNLSSNEPKELSFSFEVEPEEQASFPGGQEKVKDYIKEHVIDKISKDKLKQYQLAVVKFFIDEEGLVYQPEIFWSSEDEHVDNIMKDAICNMPKWNPATYEDGHKVKQEFVLTLGDQQSCVMPMLNIKSNPIRNKEDKNQN